MFIAFFGTIPLSAQIVFQSSQFRNLDTLPEGIARSGFSAKVPREAGYLWNFSAIKGLSNQAVPFVRGPLGADHWRTDLGENLNSQAALPYWQGYATTDSSFGVVGHWFQEMRLSLALLTGEPKDEVFVPEALIPFRLPELKFPAQMGQTSKYQTYRDITFKLTLTIEGLDNATCFIRSYFSVEDSLCGDGSLRLPRGDGNGFTPVEILQRKRILKRIDSFFVEGAPASQSLLTFFNIIQGRASDAYSLTFWKAGLKIPAAEFYYADSTFQTIVSASFSREGDFPASLEFLPMVSNKTIYPNPSQHIWNFFDKDIQQIHIYDMSGKKMGTETVSNHTYIHNLKAGVYFVILENKNGEMKQTEIQIVQ